jgi:hypothetical protein
MEQLDLESSNMDSLDENFDGIYSNITAPSADQINAGIQAAQQAAQLISTLPKNAAKKALKDNCGRKPLGLFKSGKAKLAAYSACHADFDKAKRDAANAANNPAPDNSGGGNSGGGTGTSTSKDTSQDTTFTPPPAPKKFLGMPQAVGIGVTIGVVILVGVGGFLLYKKFGSKGAAPVAAAV